MTPKREAYLAKCSEWEVEVRNRIRLYKQQIRLVKESLKYGYDDKWYRHCLRKHKRYLMMYRHELARLKGMDKVVVPIPIKAGRETFPDQSYICKCLKYLGWVKDINYCPSCGRSILWEKVK